ncbi:MAG: hydroxylamine reductase [Planctomycetes bacterium]|nr:hydroxylamine reductase [Planctomycetota bacterium]
MFCYQCEQTARGTGCTAVGVCGKDPDTAALQDLLVHATKGISMYAHRAARLGARDDEVDLFVVEALFTTVTNVNFDPERVAAWVRRAAKVRDKARALYEAACAKAGKAAEELAGPAALAPAAGLDALVRQGREVTVEARAAALGPDLTGLQELVLYGLKGAAAYADHAQVLGQTDEAAFAKFHEILDCLTRPKPTVDDLKGWAMETGQLNLRIMELLDEANTGAYGHPQPTAVRITPVKGKCIVVSGHDLRDLEELLKQTEGKGIHVYTHGEMLPAHGYPGLRKYKHLVGNYGGAWQDQRKEFDAFPGAILMTTNCIQKPKDEYKGRIFTSGLVAWPGVRHIGNRDFAPVIEAALAAPGFAEDAPAKSITVGFGHEAVLGVADKVIAAVKVGNIRHFFLIGGCDGAKPGRNYYTELAEAVPDDCVILTLACGKYRFNKLDFGDIGGIPRLLDVGQCNDAYSAIEIALALAKAFDCGVNDLPLSLHVSWFEQKAVAILLTLLSLGVKHIRLGPTLPAFVTPPVLGVLVEQFGLAANSDVASDIAAALAAK